MTAPTLREPLKPCPFCGTSPIGVEGSIQCPTCDFWWDKAETWNRRVPEPAPAEGLMLAAERLRGGVLAEAIEAHRKAMQSSHHPDGTRVDAMDEDSKLYAALDRYAESVAFADSIRPAPAEQAGWQGPWKCEKIVNGTASPSHNMDYVSPMPGNCFVCDSPLIPYDRRAARPVPDMQSIMAGNGHPDEGPCVVCGVVFDTHAEGCVFDRPAPDALKIAMEDALAACRQHEPGVAAVILETALKGEPHVG